MEALVTEPGGSESLATALPEDVCDCGLIGLGRSGRECEPHLSQAELEQAIAAAGLTVVVAFRRRPGEDLDLPIVETEAAIDAQDLRLNGALVRQEQARRAALDDGWRDRTLLDVGERLCREHHAGILLAQSLEPLSQLCPEGRIIEREPALVDNQQGGPAIKTSLDAMKEIGEHGGG